VIEIIVQPTGDRAEADGWPSAQAAARQLMREARAQGCSRPTASYVLDGALVRESVSRSEVA
jgi:hypothetical protein